MQYSAAQCRAAQRSASYKKSTSQRSAEIIRIQYNAAQRSACKNHPAIPNTAHDCIYSDCTSAFCKTISQILIGRDLF